MNKNFEAWNIPQCNKDEFNSLSIAEKCKYLISLATLAPNTHNAQPWTFSFQENPWSITVYLNRKRVLPASAPTGRQSVISVGAAIENIVTASNYYGITASIQYISTTKLQLTPLLDNSNDCYTPLVQIQFSQPSEILHTLPLDTIFKRKVLRVEFDMEKTVNNEILQEVQSIATEYNTFLHLIHDPIRRRAISEFQGQADGFVINSKKFSRELGDWLLPNDTTSFLGMPGNTFGLQDEQAKRLRAGLSGITTLEPEDGLRFSLAGKRYIEKSPFVGCITTESDEPSDWLQTGRTLEKIFLFLTSKSIGLAIHAGIVEVGLINRMFAATLGTTKRITSLFRFGYLKNEADWNQPHSPRLPVEDTIIS